MPFRGQIAAPARLGEDREEDAIRPCADAAAREPAGLSAGLRRQHGESSDRERRVGAIRNPRRRGGGRGEPSRWACRSTGVGGCGSAISNLRESAHRRTTLRRTRRAQAIEKQYARMDAAFARKDAAAIAEILMPGAQMGVGTVREPLLPAIQGEIAKGPKLATRTEIDGAADGWRSRQWRWCGARRKTRRTRHAAW